MRPQDRDREDSPILPQSAAAGPRCWRCGAVTVARPLGGRICSDADCGVEQHAAPGGVPFDP